VNETSLILPRWFAVAALAVALLMTLGMLCYPAGYDQAVFQIGGELVRGGGIPWRDFLDTKPPLVFYLFSISNWLFGANDWSFRLVDVLLQLCSAYYLYRVARRYLSSDFSQFASAVYLMMYAALGFWHTAQVEGFVSFLIVACIDLSLRRASKLHAVLFGLCLLLLFLFKFTLVLAPLGMLFWLIRTKQQGRWGFASTALLSSLLMLAVIVVFLSFMGLLGQYVQVVQWLLHYSAIVRTTDSFFVGLWRFVLWAVLSPTPIMVIAACVATRMYYKHSFEESEATFVSLCITVTLFSLCGVLIEGKMFEYQYSRAFIPLAPLAAIGIARGVQYFRKKREGSIKRQLMLAGALFLAVLMSPLLKVLSQTIPWTIVRLHTHDAEARVQRRIPDYFASEQREAGEYLKRKLRPGEQMFFWGNDVAIYKYAGRLPQTICLTATPLRSVWTPDDWKDTLSAQLKAQRPKYFVVEKGDEKQYITGSIYDSYSALIGWLRLRNILFNNYQFDTTIGHFMIYQRTADSTMRSQRSANEIPAAWAASGSRLVAVMPGNVLISRHE
jgi:hypothetical protein